MINHRSPEKDGKFVLVQICASAYDGESLSPKGTHLLPVYSWFMYLYECNVIIYSRAWVNNILFSTQLSILLIADQVGAHRREYACLRQVVLNVVRMT